MSNWTARLPYAQRYITETLFEGTEADLNLPEEIFLMEPTYRLQEPDMCHPELMYLRWLTDIHLKYLTSHYFELSVSLKPGGRSLVAIGYAADSDEILYGNGGWIFTARGGSNRQSRSIGISYGAGDIIGCGYEFPSRFFFTKNGVYLGHYIAQLGLNTLRPAIRTWDNGLGYYKPTNLGQQPFKFDIEGHFNERYARSRRLAANLPLEILENVLQRALLSQGISHIVHLSRVCRRWHTLTFRSVIDLSIVTRKDLEGLLTILRTRTPIDARSVTTQESPDETLLHRFLASPLPLIKSTSTLAMQTSIPHQSFLEKAPSVLSQSVPGLLRRAFTEVHTFKLSGYSFSTWTRFAQVVFALQRLETLVCSSVTWDSGPIAPPTWLTFSKRLRHASFEDMGNQCMAGSLWLFLAGRPRQPSDDLVLIPSDISIIGQLASLLLMPSFTPPRNQVLAFSRDYIIYDQKQDQPRSCTLSFKRQSQSLNATDLAFQFEGNGVTYRVTRIYVRPALQAFSIPDDSTLREIGRCSTALSSANLCHFCFEFSGIQPTGGPHHRRRVAKAMMQQHSAGLLKCTWDGEAIEDTEGVQWLGAGAVVTFGNEKTYKRGTSGKITWNVHSLRPHLSRSPRPPYIRVPSIIHWVKLYKHDNESFGSFIADVAFDISAESGQAEFLLPDSAAPGRYFLVVGDYIYRTKCFQIIP